MKVRFVGLDVHKNSIAIAVADEGRAPGRFVCEEKYDVERVVRRLHKLAADADVCCAYEAGPTGLGLQRALTRAGFDCIVVAPSRVPDRRHGRVKTDELDAIRLAEGLRSRELAKVLVHDEMTEAMRDLSRAREDAMTAKQKARQQLSGFLLRHERHYPSKSKQGTQAHLDWCRRQRFELEAHRRVLASYIAAFESAQLTEAQLLKDMEELLPTWGRAPMVTALMALCSVRLITAVALVSEIGDFTRFAKPVQLANFLGLTPSIHASGERSRNGPITKAGNGHVRRLLVEASRNYRHDKISPLVRKRWLKVPAEVQSIARKAHGRLYRRQFALLTKGKNSNVVAIAVARELSCFAWAIANSPSVTAEVEKYEATLKQQTA